MNIKKMLNFDVPMPEFELLETEKGTPSFFGEFHDAKPRRTEKTDEKVPSSLEKVEARLKKEFHTDINTDVIVRPFMIGRTWQAIAVFINGMTDNKSVNEFILRDSMQNIHTPEALEQEAVLDFCIKSVFTFGEAEIESKWSKIKKGMLDGKTAVFIEGQASVIIMDTRGYERRTITAPQNEKVVRGPHEGFTENLRTNITQLRRIIRTDDFICEFRNSGGDNALTVAIAYREGVANVSLIEEIKRRLAQIDTRMVIAEGMLEQLTEKKSLSVFPQVLSTERPDRVASCLMQGHVAILLEGSPFANIMPTTLFSLMTSSEDAYLRRPQGSVVRMIRFIGAAISVVTPGIILALATYHQGFLSTEMLATLITSRVMVFAPMGLEMIFLLLVFQLIREAGLRVAGGISQAVGIIGGLILGQAAVSANLVSSVVLIIVALTGLGNFCIPDYSTQIGAVYIRLALVMAAWVGGLLGLTSMLMIIVADMARTKSFGIPFLSPFAPKTSSKHPMILRGKLTMHQRAADYVNTQEE
ncbi:MAG: spore germination protein [Clostridia bacterium]|nr:spore germination protein [Clostridia bacterium]